MTRRHNDLFKMPNDIFDAPLNATELMVLAAVYSLRSRSIHKGVKYVRVNQQTIATLCGLKSTKTVSKAIDKLRRLEYNKRIDRYYDDYKKLGSYVYAIPVIRGRAFFFVNRRFLRFGLTAAQTRMYLYCCKCADSHSMRFWNSYNDICSALHLKRSAVVQTLKELVSLGLIRKYRVRKKDGSYSDNHYRIIALKPPRIRRRKGKRRSRFALGFSQSRNCKKILTIKYILNHKSENVNTLRIYFFDLRGSPKIYRSLLVPTFITNRERKRLVLYLEYRCNLGRDFFRNRSICALREYGQNRRRVEKPKQIRVRGAADQRRADQPHTA